jgi:DNA polymerase III alpha subunit (gram-positive type)
VSAEITEITGITADRAAMGGKPEKSLLHMWDLLADDPILVGHNAQFDLAMVAWNSIRRGIEVRFPSEFVCTRFMANAIFSQGHKLQNLIDRFGWQVEQTHRAVEDLWWTEKVLIEMYPTVARMGIRWKNSAVYLGGVANDDYGLTGINWQPWGFKPKE